MGVMSALDAAANVLGSEGRPLRVEELTERMLSRVPGSRRAGPRRQPSMPSWRRT